MKFFTGSLAAGLVLLAGGAQAQVPGPYMAASDFDAPYAVAPPRFPGRSTCPDRTTDPGRARIRPKPAAVDGSLLRAARQRILAARHPQAARLRLHDCGDRPRRRGRPADNRRAQRPDYPLRAGLPDGRQFYEEQSALHGSSGAQLPQAQAPDHVQAAPPPSRPAPRVASRAVPMPKASPIAAKPAPAPMQQAAAPAPKSAEVQAAAPVTTGAAPAKPAPQIAPTQDMPTMQGLE